MSFISKLFGKQLASSASKKHELTVLTGVPALGLDALASTGYGPEAALIILLPLGLLGLHYFFILSLMVIGQLLILCLSYQQTAAAYPMGGGAYTVASANLGKYPGLYAAAALLIDYLLNVTVGISAGVGAIVSALPFLQPYTIILCLFILMTLTMINLRGIRESGLIFIYPAIAFIVCMGIALVMGLAKTWLSLGHPLPVILPPPVPAANATISTWLLLCAFANGLTAMTGIEAVSNAVPLFCKPTITNARRTLTIIVLILSLFLLAIGYLSPSYHIAAMDENLPGYKTVLAQIVAAVTGNGIFYYIALATIFFIMTFSAQTSFADFPRVCRLLAEDCYLPHFFADRGRRLVYSSGIIILALIAAVLLIMFDGITQNLIPLFAIGAFSAFFLSQAGMVLYWRRNRDKRTFYKIFFNVLGALTTFLALIIMIIAKFTHGAWLTILAIPSLVVLFVLVNKHYAKVNKEIGRPLNFEASPLLAPIIIVPINGWDRVSEKALRFGVLLSNNITAVYISTNKEEISLRETWATQVEQPAKAASATVPRLEIINSPYRLIYKPILDFIHKTKRQNPNQQIIVLIPELFPARWYEYLLHNVHAEGLGALLMIERDKRTIVIKVPWYIKER